MSQKAPKIPKSNKLPPGWTLTAAYPVAGSYNRRVAAQHTCGYVRSCWFNNVHLLQCPNCDTLTIHSGKGLKSSTMVLVNTGTKLVQHQVLTRLPFVHIPKGHTLYVPTGEEFVQLYRNDVSRFDWIYIKNFNTISAKAVDVPYGFVKQTVKAWKAQHSKTEEDFLIEKLSRTESEIVEDLNMLPEELAKTLDVQAETGTIPIPSYYPGLQIPLVAQASFLPYLLGEGDDDLNNSAQEWMQNNGIPLDADVDFSPGATFKVNHVDYTWVYVSVPKGVTPTPWLRESDVLAQCMKTLEVKD